ncbi:MAG: SiaC family regulatory phosphoprotein [Bacteroidales bacterium]
MSQQVIKETQSTPGLLYDSKQRHLKLSGISIPEDPRPFYAEVHKRCQELQAKSDGVDCFIFRMDYFNTLSAKYLYNLMQALSEDIPAIRFVWEYEPDDEDLLEAGEDFADMLGSDFFEFRQIKLQ